MTFELPKLNFTPNDLGGFMSEDTINYHYGKHHKAYADKANTAISGTEYENLTIEEIIKQSYNKNTAVFNNTAQYYNHCVLWEIMDSSTDKSITTEFESEISKEFGSFDTFKEEFTKLAMSQFGSGWCWLSKNKDGKLTLSKTPNGENPLLNDETPLVACDVWEHSYYLDYQNKRDEYIKNFLDKLVNWKIVEKRFNS